MTKLSQTFPPTSLRLALSMVFFCFYFFSLQYILLQTRLLSRFISRCHHGNGTHGTISNEKRAIKLVTEMGRFYSRESRRSPKGSVNARSIRLVRSDGWRPARPGLRSISAVRSRSTASRFANEWESPSEDSYNCVFTRFLMVWWWGEGRGE